MRFAVLGSGSGGNSLVVDSGGCRLLVDAGFSCRRIETTLRDLGLDAARLNAVLLSHEHQDHVCGASRLAPRHELPIYATAGTLRQAKLSEDALARSRTIRSGEPFEITSAAGGFRVEPFRIPHDAREPIGFVVEDAKGCRLGVVTDLGSRTRLAWGRLRDLDALVIESNHDLSMLRGGPYPWHLKQRVASRHGHLSNHEACRGIEELLDDRLRHVVLYHLSRTNNRPELAQEVVGEMLGRHGSEARLMVAEQDTAGPWIEVMRGGQLSLWG